MAIKGENKKTTSVITVIYRLLPLLLLFFIGLIKTSTHSYHQKVFKTELILFSCAILIMFVFLLYKKKSKLSLLHIFFAVFLFLYVFQYIVTFFSGEISYDREYYIANYIFLLVFSFFTALFFNEESDFFMGNEINCCIDGCFVLYFNARFYQLCFLS